MGSPFSYVYLSSISQTSRTLSGCPQLCFRILNFFPVCFLSTVVNLTIKSVVPEQFLCFPQEFMNLTSSLVHGNAFSG